MFDILRVLFLFNSFDSNHDRFIRLTRYLQYFLILAHGICCSACVVAEIILVKLRDVQNMSVTVLLQLKRTKIKQKMLNANEYFY